MPEIVFDKLQLGLQTGTPAAPGAAVAATLVYPIDAGIIDPDLDRGYESPDEDFGMLARHQPGRGSYGLRSAGVPLTFVMRFEDIMRFLEMRLAGAITPSGSNPYTWTYTADNTSDTTKVYTAEVGSESSSDEYQLSTCTVTDFEIGFDQLSAPGESPWKATVTLQALDRSVATFTAALGATAGMETIEGHLTTLLQGATGTAFGSLTELANHLVMYKLKLSGERPYRSYGGATDLSVGYGIKKPEATVEAEVRISSSSKTAIYDAFNAAGAVAPEKRWRIAATGSALSSGTKVFRLDHRLRFNSVKRTEREGEALYSIGADAIYDSTLASYLQAVVINAINGPLT